MNKLKLASVVHYRPFEKYDFIQSLKKIFTGLNFFESQEKCFLAFNARSILLCKDRMCFQSNINLHSNGKESWKRKMLALHRTVLLGLNVCNLG